MQHYQVFAYMIDMLVDHRLDSASSFDFKPRMHWLIALQSYNEIDGNVA